DYNAKKIKEKGGDVNKAIDDIVTLQYEGHSIWNPLLDETLRDRVDSDKKYGVKNIEEFIEDYNQK
ncbi:MAG: hypothetical protein ACOCRX_07980, partial [Candidatus Woesearchaeota archaeon]